MSNNVGMYKEEIMELYKSPLHSKHLSDATHVRREFNASCGDDFTLSLVVRDDVIVDVGFTGTGCAISTAAISLLCERLKGMNFSAINNIDADVVLGDLGVNISPSRMKCAMIGLEALKRMQGARS